MCILVSTFCGKVLLGDIIKSGVLNQGDCNLDASNSSPCPRKGKDKGLCFSRKDQISAAHADICSVKVSAIVLIINLEKPFDGTSLVTQSWPSLREEWVLSWMKEQGAHRGWSYNYY